MVDAGIEAQFIDRIGAFFRSSGDTNHAHALDLAKLTNQRANGAGRCTHHKGLAFFRATMVQQTHISRDPRHPQDADTGLDRSHIRIDLAHHLAVADCVCAPAKLAVHDVSHSKSRVLRFDHFAYATAFHATANLDCCGVGFALVHASTHVRVQRLPQDLDQDAAIGAGGNGFLFQSEVRQLRRAFRARRKYNFFHHLGHGFLLTFRRTLRLKFTLSQPGTSLLTCGQSDLRSSCVWELPVDRSFPDTFWHRLIASHRNTWEEKHAQRADDAPAIAGLVDN